MAYGYNLNYPVIIIYNYTFRHLLNVITPVRAPRAAPATPGTPFTAF